MTFHSARFLLFQFVLSLCYAYHFLSRGLLSSHRIQKLPFTSKQQRTPPSLLHETSPFSKGFINETALISIDLNEELKTSFMAYAFSTILGRALPDARDGLKPVHRRVLYAMKVLGLTPESGYRKCARIVGEVLGKYHPHGDQSVYDALVRMAQDFVMLHPLIAGHGNFGSVDNDPPAAMRYTEAKLSHIAFETLLADIDEETVDFSPNFDGNEVEPMVLPARLPILLLNGASGIAVGMATNIPPHNLNELVDAMIALIDTPSFTIDDLMEFIPAPDFPTGGEIIGVQGSKDFFSTGHGSITLRGKAVIAEGNAKSTSARAKNSIVITELPYMTNKAVFLEKIAEMVNDKRLEGISDLRDESDRDGIRVVIELKRDALPDLVLNNLYQKTALQVNFAGNMVTLTQNGTQPSKINLKEAIQSFIQFRFETIRRRSKYQLQRLQTRDHIVLGLIEALRRIDEIIAITKTSNNSNEALQRIMALRSSNGTNEGTAVGVFSAEQAESILSLTLRRLTSFEEKKLNEEHEDLTHRIQNLEKILKEEKEVYKIMKAESLQLKKKYGKPRQSTIINDEAKELSQEDLVPNEQSIIILTESGYIKRIPLTTFEAQSRGGRGKAGAKLSNEEDAVAHFISCKDHDSLIFFSDSGIAYGLKAYQVPLSSRTAKGAPIPQVLTIKSDEKITSIFAVDEFKDNEFIILLSQNGIVKKIPLNSLSKISARGLVVTRIGEDDCLRWARRCTEKDEIVIGTKNGFAGRFSTEEIPTRGRATRGSKCMSIRKGDTIAGCDVVNAVDVSNTTQVILVTNKGYGKKVDLSDLSIGSRKRKGAYVIKFKSKLSDGEGEGDHLRSIRISSSEEDELVLSTAKGTVTRLRVNDIGTKSRRSSGVKLQNIPPGDFLSTVDIVCVLRESEGPI